MAFLKDLEWSVRLDPELYATRPFASRLAEERVPVVFAGVVRLKLVGY